MLLSVFWMTEDNEETLGIGHGWHPTLAYPGAFSTASMHRILPRWKENGARKVGGCPLRLVHRLFLLCLAITFLLMCHTVPLLRYVASMTGDTQVAKLGQDSLFMSTLISKNDESTSPPMESDCLVHVPLKADFYHVQQPNHTLAVLRQATPKVCGSLRRDWTQMLVQSTLAQELEAHQSNCALPLVGFPLDNDFGLGSHLVLWSQALCNAMELGYRVRAINPQWLWMDEQYCDPQRAKLSPLLCYFPQAEIRCATDETFDDNGPNNINLTLPDPRDRRQFCQRLHDGNMSEQKEELLLFRSASMEYLFQSLSPLVIKEAERQIGLLFNGGRTPPGLISVHIRWGDKFWEMDLAPIEEYIVAIHTILQQRTNLNISFPAVNIYLASEDPQAVAAFLQAAPTDWKIFVDRTLSELTPYRPQKGNRASWVARNTHGRAGLVALGSLLVAMEANDFVLTTKSNWSRLMDALRRNVIEPRCGGNCTTVIDLRPGVW